MGVVKEAANIVGWIEVVNEVLGAAEEGLLVVHTKCPYGAGLHPVHGGWH